MFAPLASAEHEENAVIDEFPTLNLEPVLVRLTHTAPPFPCSTTQLTKDKFERAYASESPIVFEATDPFPDERVMLEKEVLERERAEEGEAKRGVLASLMFDKTDDDTERDAVLLIATTPHPFPNDRLPIVNPLKETLVHDTLTLNIDVDTLRTVAGSSSNPFTVKVPAVTATSEKGMGPVEGRQVTRVREVDDPVE